MSTKLFFFFSNCLPKIVVHTIKSSNPDRPTVASPFKLIDT